VTAGSLEEEQVDVLPVQMTLAVEGEVRRHQLVHVRVGRGLAGGVPCKSDRVLESAGRRDVVDDPVSVAEVSELGDAEALCEHEGPDRALGEEGLAKREARVAAPLDQQDPGSLSREDGAE
jgi:hypothetical protein